MKINGFESLENIYHFKHLFHKSVETFCLKIYHRHNLIHFNLQHFCFKSVNMSSQLTRSTIITRPTLSTST